jgi:hypothetical protein
MICATGNAGCFPEEAVLRAKGFFSAEKMRIPLREKILFPQTENPCMRLSEDFAGDMKKDGLKICPCAGEKDSPHWTD